MKYPGSKTKQASELMKRIPLSVTDWAEPFVGSGALTIAVANRQSIERIHINDLDYGIIALWTAVTQDHRRLIARIHEFVPTADRFYEFKECLNNGGTDDIIEDGFRKLALHQISWSGLGGKAGSPIGGKSQSGQYHAGSRWSPKRHEAWVQKAHDALVRSDVTITQMSWENCLDAEFLYLDPPYYLAGKRLYQHGTLDHAELATSLQRRSGWLLSYDEHPEIRRLYDEANVENWEIRSELHHKIIEDVIITPTDGNAALWERDRLLTKAS